MIVEITLTSDDGSLLLENAASDNDVIVNVEGHAVTVSIEELKHALRKLTAK